ncbi:MAG TPA: YncE family protein [Caulobacteraceae bacterium]|nr:YncE family protein [Caulobacteraceae bacterium]
MAGTPWRRPVVLAVAAAILVVAGFAVALIYPGTPGAARSLKFQGYVVLPKGGALNILDYMTISGGDLFVTSVSSGDVYKIALSGSAAVIAVLPGPPAAHGVAVDPVSRMAYVTRSEANVVDVFDPATMRRVKRIPVADDADGIFYDPANRLIYADSGDAKVATLIDPATQTAVATIALGGAPEFAAFDPETKLFYQNLKDANSVAAVDLAKRSVIQRWALDQCRGPSGMAIDAARRRLFVVCAANARLVIFNLDTHRVTSWLPIGGGPDSVGYDAGLHRIYTTGRSGVLSVVQQDSPDSYRQLDQINLHFGAHTLAVDPATHKLYVAYASLLLPARVAVFAPVNSRAPSS